MCVTQPTVNRLVRLCGKHHDSRVKQWQKKWTESLESPSASSQPAEARLASSDDCGISESHSESSSSTVPCNTVATPHPCSYIIVGDNVDKNVSPRDMRVDHQTQSLHYFNSYVTLDRVDGSQLAADSSTISPDDIMAIPISAILPTAQDCSDLRRDYIVLVARVPSESLPYFKGMRHCVPNITHAHSSELCKKSETVIFTTVLYFNYYTV